MFLDRIIPLISDLSGLGCQAILNFGDWICLLSSLRREQMKKTSRYLSKTFFCLFFVSLLAFGCAHTRTVVIEIPPRIDLQPYQTIGIVGFTSNSTEKLNQIATQKFMGVIQGAQPQVRFLELGPEDQLVKKLGRERMDLETIRAIGKKYNVSSIFTGAYEITNLSPQVSFGKDLSSMDASMAVVISMVSKHLDTGTGVTIWTNSRQGHWKTAAVHRNSEDISFSLAFPEDQYGQDIEELAYALTDNFRHHFDRRRVPE